jgi:uncharacterized protein (PEP-CTERM system associated)
MTLKRRVIARAVRAGAACAIAAGASFAAHGEHGAFVQGDIVHSDNLRLAPPGNEVSEDIGEITAGFNFTRSEPRLDARVGYQLQSLLYNHESSSDEIFNALDANTQIGLIVDRLFLDAFAVYDQTVVDPAGEYSFNNLALTSNRTDVAIVGLAPRLALAAGPNVLGELRYGYTNVNYHDATLLDTVQQVITFVLGNTEARKGGSWTVSYNADKYDYKGRDSIDFEIFNVELGYWAGPVRLFTTQGLESDYTLVAPGPLSTGSGSPGLDEYYWEVGLEWVPSERTSLLAVRGERSFGESHRFRFSHRARGGGISVSYTEEPSSFARDQIYSARNVGELSPIDSLDGPSGNPFFLQKRSDVAFMLERSRSSAGLRFFDDRRYDIVAEVNSAPTSLIEELRGIELNYQWKFTDRATLGVAVQAAERSNGSIANFDNELRNIGINWVQQMGRASELEFVVAQQRSEPMGATVVNLYTENQASVGFRRRFGSDSGGSSRRYSRYLNASE